ncbi:MAG: hypothetical protein A2068_02895 [Ignavibacteria bacterium GWB2_35_6b]|nr:MAG: hypothetical protein A2068_02895 [Ignavibacteria bacterium GWB2_35_6b]
MFRNYYYLNRAVTELNSILHGLKVAEIFTQEKNRLYFSVGNSEFPERHLIISTDQNLPYFQIKNEHYKAKKNAVNFFSEFLPDRIEKVEIAETDRIIKFTLTSSEIYFTIRGKDTNVLIINSGGSYKSFKKIVTDEENLLKEFKIAEYTNNAVIPDFNQLINNEFESVSLKNSFPQITKDFLNEAKIRTKSGSTEELLNNLSKIILEIFSEPISVFYNETENKMFFVPSSFYSAKEQINSETGDSYLNAINKYLSLKYKNENSAKIRNDIEKHLEKELYKLSGKLNNLKKRIEEGSKEDVYKKYGTLLLANIHLLIEKREDITVIDYLTNEEVKIKLNSKIQPKQNVDWYFEKSRDEKINYKKSIELYESSKIIYDKLLTIKSEFEKASGLDELNSIKDKLKIKTEKQPGKKMEEQIKFKHYLVDGQYHVYVGRDSKSNDLLSTKFAKQNDYWFHARGLPGSHVVLRVDNTKEVIPKTVIKDVASLAAYHSKAKTAGTAPVAYTFAKFVYKKKGMEPGQVIVQKEKVILVKPEIPKSCEMLEE